MTDSEVLWLPDEAATVEFGKAFGVRMMSQFGGTALVFLQGELGAGKTTLVRGLLRGLGHSGAVKSPTYTLLEPYACNGQDVYHFDLYRVNDPQELSLVGFDEIIDGPGLKLVEWAERAQQWLPAADAIVRLCVGQASATAPPMTEDGIDQSVGREVTVEIF